MCARALSQSGGIQKSVGDDRDYRYLVLSNGLRVTLVSDPKADKVREQGAWNIGARLRIPPKLFWLGVIELLLAPLCPHSHRLAPLWLLVWATSAIRRSCPAWHTSSR